MLAEKRINAPVVALIERVVHTRMSKRISGTSVATLTALVRPTNHLLKTVIERVLHHAHGLGWHHALRLGGCTMGEQGFVYLEQGALVIHKQVQDVRLVFAGKVTDLDPVLSQLCQAQQTFFKLFCLL